MRRILTGGLCRRCAIESGSGELKLVMYVEEEFKVQIEAHEADKEHLDTVADIVGLIESKQK
jgi:hypothetical protein